MRGKSTVHVVDWKLLKHSEILKSLFKIYIMTLGSKIFLYKT